MPEGSRQEATSPLHPVGQLLPARAQLILPGVVGSRSKTQHCPQLPVRGDGGGDGPGLPGSCAQPGEEHTAPHTLGTRQAAAQTLARHDDGMTHRSRKITLGMWSNLCLDGCKVLP